MCYSGDATCTLEPFKLSSTLSPVAHASAKNVSDAARAVIQECVVRRRIGGAADKIGEFDPTVRWDVRILVASVVVRMSSL